MSLQNPRSGFKHKAWGGAKRNPRITRRKNTERAKRPTAQKRQFARDEIAVGHFVGFLPHTVTHPGVSLRSTPGFMLSPRFAGLRESFMNLIRASFSLSLV